MPSTAAPWPVRHRTARTQGPGRADSEDSLGGHVLDREQGSASGPAGAEPVSRLRTPRVSREQQCEPHTREPCVARVGLFLSGEGGTGTEEQGALWLITVLDGMNVNRKNTCGHGLEQGIPEAPGGG